MTWALTATLVCEPALLAAQPSVRATTSPAATSRSEDVPEPQRVGTPPLTAPNRTRPDVRRPRGTLVLGETPSRAELGAAHVLPERLVPIGTAGEDGDVDERRALARAMVAYARSNRPTDVTPFGVFMQQYPSSPWRASLLVNVGTIYRDMGALSRALQAWDEAWLLAKGATDLQARAVADAAVGAWLQLATTLGQVERVTRRLADLAGRDVRGPAGVRVQEAREGVAFLQTLHHEAFFSSKVALTALLETLRPGAPVPRAVQEYIPPHEGASLHAVRDVARTAGLELSSAHVSREDELPVPAIVHLTVEHYTAVVGRQGTALLVQDAVLGGRRLVDESVLREEMSGYVLLPTRGSRTPGRTVEEAEARHIVGRCAPGGPSNQDPTQCPGGGPGGTEPRGGGPSEPAGGTCGQGMPVYSFHPVSTSLQLWDNPVGYTSAIGPSVRFQLVYDQYDSRYPQVAAASSVGPQWSFDWMGWVSDNNYTTQPPYVWFEVVLRGTGSELYTSLNARHWRSRAQFVRVSADPIVYERRLPDGTVERYDVPDREASLPNRKVYLSKVIDPQGHAIEFTYDEQFRLAAVTDATELVTTLQHAHPTDPLKVTSVTDPFGRTATLAYDALGRLASITDAIGMTSRVAYGASDFVQTLTTPYGITTFASSSQHVNLGPQRTIQATDPLGATERLEFWWNQPALSATAPLSDVPDGLATANASLDHYNSFYWDKRAWAAHPGDRAHAVVYNWTYRGDSAHMHPNSRSVPHSIKSPGESRVWYRYPEQSADARASGTGAKPTVTARVLADGSTQQTLATYNTDGYITSRTDPVGRQTTYTYAANGQDLLDVRQVTSSGTDLLAQYGDYTAAHLPETVVDAAGSTTLLTYNTAGQVLTQTNALAETTTFAYDTDGRLTSVTGPVSGATVTSTYDAAGRLATQTQPDGYTLAFTYDALDRPLRVTYPDGTYEETTYDRLDVVARRDRLGRMTRSWYDPVRRLVATRDPLGRIVRQEWCACGSLDALIDGKGQRTSWERDARGRVTREVRADGLTETVSTYDLTGRLVTVTDPKGQVTTYTYTPDDQVASLAFTNAAVATPGVTYTYDARYPRVASLVDGTGTTTYAYHAAGTAGAGQVASVDGPLTNDTIAYTYDALGRVSSRAINGAANTLSYGYDALGRVTSEVNVLGTFTYGYDGVSSRLASVLYPNGQTSAYSYLPATHDHRLETIHHRYPSTATLSRFDYTYDAVGNIRTWRQQADSDPAIVWTYDYDAADQLIGAVKATTATTPTILSAQAWAYDAAANRTRAQVDEVVTTTTHDALNRLVSETAGGTLRIVGQVNEPADVTIDGVPALVDASGRFVGTVAVTPGTTTFGVVATDGSANATAQTYEVDTASATAKTFTFDANGNMTSDGTRTFEWDARNQLVAVNVGTHRSEFAYDGSGRWTRIVEKDTGATTRDVHLVWDRLQLAEERLAPGEVNRFFVNAWAHDGTARFLTRDHLGSSREATDAGGALVTRDAYDPYGQRARVAGSQRNPFGFTGHYAHDPSGLTLATYRAYDPMLGRWVSEDPIGLAGGLNLQEYVSSNPVKLLDPDGLSPFVGVWPGAGIGGAMGGPVGAVAGGVIGGVVGLIVGTELYEWWSNELAEHTKGKRSSTKEKHQRGDERRGRDQGGEKSDWSQGGPRRKPTKRPSWYKKGPWPGKQKSMGLPWDDTNICEQ